MSGIETFPAGTLGRYDYVVIVSGFQGKLLLSRHKGRKSWELQGGHIEPGETPEEAARRELFEESGALSFDLTPLCDYRGEEPGRNNFGCGMVYLAEIHELGPLPESEMEERKCFETLPDQLTYPDITRAIFSFMNDYYSQMADVVDKKLIEAEVNANNDGKRYSRDEMYSMIKSRLYKN